MKNIIEFYYQGECIEQRKYNDLFIEPQIGDVVNIQFTNPSYNEYGNWWLVQERRIIFFDMRTPNLRQTLMVNILPDKHKGEWKSDPFYNRETH
jgi:hypothetical protein